MLSRTGVGLRLPHLEEVVAHRPSAGWLEIHPENFVANPHATELLLDLARDYPISVHTVGVSIGSAHGVDRAHLVRVRRLVDLIKPVLISGHVAWSTHPGEYLNDLLPMPYDDETLAVLVRHVDEVQDAFGTPYLVENPSSYVGYGRSTMNEAQFLTELARRTGCRLLCDVSNVHLSAHNMAYDARAYLDGLPGDAIAEFHLGGFSIEDDGSPGSTVIVDTHGSAIDDAALELYGYALGRFGWKPTLVEWDNDLPTFDALLGQAGRVDALATTCCAGHQERAHVAG